MTLRSLFGRVLGLPKRQDLSRVEANYSPETVARAKYAFRKADKALLRMKTATSAAPRTDHFGTTDLVSG